jgi:hypothetical protein
LVGVEGGSCLPHLELRRGDRALLLRFSGPALPDTAAAALRPFRGKTPVALVAWSGEEEAPVSLQLAGEPPQRLEPGAVLASLARRLEPGEKGHLAIRRAA